MMRHLLGILGVIAAGILLVVSAAMNYRFGFSLGKTAIDGQIYGLASAAADCFKALIPFFFFAAIRNRMWSQAMAAALVWTVVIGYSMTSALGHAALNRLDTSGKRAVQAAAYQDLRADAARAKEQLGWIPQHRPASTVQSDINGVKNQRAWAVTSGCTDVTGRSNREFCQQYHKLNAELASAQEAEKLESRIAEIGTKLAMSTATSGGTVMTEADPQATVLAKLTGLDISVVQTGLTLFVALLIEIGSGFGMYVAFAYWRLDAPKAEQRTVRETTVVEVAVPRMAEARVGAEHRVAEAPRHAEPIFDDDRDAEETEQQELPPPARRLGANDNRVSHGVPDSDVQRHYRQRVVGSPGASVTAQDLYEDYCNWCEEQGKEACAMPTYSREFKTLGVRKDKIGGRIRYFDVALRPTHAEERDKKLSNAA